MDDQTEWLTLADGERLLASRLTIAGQSSSEARRTLEHWLKKMRVRMMALEVCRWIDDPDSLPLQVGLNFEIERWRHILRQAEYPNAVRENPKPEPNHPIPPLRRETEYNRNIPMDGDVERALGEPAFWSLSEVTSYLTGQLNPDARITYSGIRIANDDVERMIDLMGLAAEPAPILPNAGQGTARQQSHTITDDRRTEEAAASVSQKAPQWQTQRISDAQRHLFAFFQKGPQFMPGGTRVKNPAGLRQEYVAWTKKQTPEIRPLTRTPFEKWLNRWKDGWIPGVRNWEMSHRND